MQTQTQTQSWTQLDWTSALEDEARLLVEELDMHPAAQRLFQGSIDTSGYIAWLVQTYHYVQWTTPLLEQAGHRLKRQGRHILLAELLLQKASEERGHERCWSTSACTGRARPWRECWPTAPSLTSRRLSPSCGDTRARMADTWPS
jgi:hypothetical protein